MTRTANIFCRMMLVCIATLATGQATSAESPPVCVAVFPLAGDASADLRNQVGFAIRSKLSRVAGTHAIDGPTMADLADDAPRLSTDPASLAKLAAHEKPAVLIWGELAGGEAASVAGTTLSLKVLDLRSPGAKPIEWSRTLKEATDLRAATEEVVRVVAGDTAVRPPSEQTVVDDEQSRALWRSNPNLLPDGDFAAGAGWALLKETARTPIVAGNVPLSEGASIVNVAAAESPPNPALVIRLSQATAEGSGLSGQSAIIPIRSGRRYRVSVRYRSDSPAAYVFVKGFVKDRDGTVARECFRTQTPLLDAADGQWRTMVADVNPSHPSLTPEHLRVELFCLLRGGQITFDDVVVKDVGPLSNQSAKEASGGPLTRPVTQPAR